MSDLDEQIAEARAKVVAARQAREAARLALNEARKADHERAFELQERENAWGKLLEWQVRAEMEATK